MTTIITFNCANCGCDACELPKKTRENMDTLQAHCTVQIVLHQGHYYYFHMFCRLHNLNGQHYLFKLL